jgi:hypothetical protein
MHSLKIVPQVLRFVSTLPRNSCFSTECRPFRTPCLGEEGHGTASAASGQTARRRTWPILLIGWVVFKQPSQSLDGLTVTGRNSRPQARSVLPHPIIPRWLFGGTSILTGCHVSSQDLRGALSGPMTLRLAVSLTSVSLRPYKSSTYRHGSIEKICEKKVTDRRENHTFAGLCRWICVPARRSGRVEGSARPG